MTAIMAFDRSHRRRRPGLATTDRNDRTQPPASLLVAIVAYQGVLADETDLFRYLLGLLPNARIVTVGARLGVVAGPGGAQLVDATFDDVPRADVVVVPGGLGAHRHPEISVWLRRIQPRFVLASSTGSALLAASGLLEGRTAVTHWLAGPLLERHGVSVSTERMVVDLPYITCSGLASTFDAAFEVARRIGGPGLVRDVRQRLEERQEPPPPAPRPPAPDRSPAGARSSRRGWSRSSWSGRRSASRDRCRIRRGRPRGCANMTGWARRRRDAVTVEGPADPPPPRWPNRRPSRRGRATSCWATARRCTSARSPRPTRRRLLEFHQRQSSESIYRRYFSPKPTLSEAELAHFTNVDLVDRAALVVERYDQLIAWASYERWAGRDDADAAFMVDDAHHGKGIATLLLEHLAALARSNGIARFTAEVLADNRPMLAVFSRAGWPVERHFESGIIDLDFSLDETEEFLDSVERREQRADSRAMARLLLPRSVALVGATDRPGTVGEALWRHLTSTGGRAGLRRQPAAGRRSPAGRAGRIWRRSRVRCRWPSSPSRPMRWRR